MGVHMMIDGRVDFSKGIVGCNPLTAFATTSDGGFIMLCVDGRTEESRDMQLRLLPLIRSLFLETNPAPIKYAMHLKDFCKAEVRLPLDLPRESTREEIKKRLAYMKTLKFNAKVRKNLNAAFVSFMQTHTGIRPFEPIFINNNGIMETCIKNFLAGNNLALTGPKGVGKNILVEQLANLSDLELCDMQMSYDTAKEEVRGEPTFLEDGKIGVRLSNIVDAAQRASLINLDEVNMARGSITSLLHSLTDHRRYIEIPGYGMVKVHPQARFTITMNEGDEYEGTRQLNVAFRDRFHEIIFKPNPDNMKDVFMAKCNLSSNDAEALSKFYKLIHAAVYNADSDACIPDDYLSQRKFVRAGQLYSMCFASSIEEAFREEVVETIADPEIKGIVENLILINC
jgi:hypothetical protein